MTMTRCSPLNFGICLLMGVWNRSRCIKESWLERMIWFGEDALRQGVREFVVHYDHER